MFIRVSILIFGESFFGAEREGGGWLSSLFEGGEGKKGTLLFSEGGKKRSAVQHS